MHWILILLVLMPAWSSPAWSYSPTSEKSCTFLDLRNDSLREVRNQGGVAWCYAFSAADLLQHTLNLNYEISAADIAINYNLSFAGRSIRTIRDIFRNRRSPAAYQTFVMPHQTGFAKVAIRRALRSGFCTEEIFSSEQWDKMIKTNGGWVHKKVDLKTAMLEIYQLLENQSHLSANNLPYYFKFHNIESASDFHTLLRGKNRNTFYTALRKKVCSSTIFESHNTRAKMVLKGKQLFKKVNAQLDRDRVVSLDYDARVLKNRNNRKISLIELHTSLIVGRRWNSEKRACEYLIRDSYGDQCKRYDPTYECLGGQVWIPEKYLYRNATSIVYLQ